MTQIYFVRHAESLANTQGLYQGQTYDTGLSPLGQKQAQVLAQRFSSEKIDRLFVSPLKRTLQTAQPFNQLNIEPLLIETNHGLWEGKSKSVVQSLWPSLYTKWQTSPATVTFPGGEPFTHTLDRAKQWFQKYVNSGQTLVAITHSNVIMALLSYLKQESLNSIWKYAMQPTAVTLVQIASPLRIVYYNDTSHLTDLESDLNLHAI